MSTEAGLTSFVSLFVFGHSRGISPSADTFCRPVRDELKTQNLTHKAGCVSVIVEALHTHTHSDTVVLFLIITKPQMFDVRLNLHLVVFVLTDTNLSSWPST